MQTLKVTNYDHGSGDDGTCVDGSPGIIVKISNLEDIAPQLASLPLTADWMGRVSWKINSEWRPFFDFHREPYPNDATIEMLGAFVFPILDLDLFDEVSRLPKAEDIDITPAVEYVRAFGAAFENWMAEEALSETALIPYKDFCKSSTEESNKVWEHFIEPIKQRLVERIRTALEI